MDPSSRNPRLGPKIYSLHAPARFQGGQFIAHVKALPGNPYDGHTLETVIPEIETQIGASLARIVADSGYGGHNTEVASRIWTVD